MPFQPVNLAMRAVLMAAVVYTALTHFNLPSSVVLMVAVLGVAYWLLSHREELGMLYTARKAKGAAHVRAGKQPWRKPIEPKKIAPLVIGVGLYMLYESCFFHYEPTRKYLLNMLHAVLGDTGTVVALACAGVVVLTEGVEILVGGTLPPAQEPAVRAEPGL